MSEIEPLVLESPNTRKDGKRGARKFGSGERGFQTGTYPQTGPFEIHRKRTGVRTGDAESLREGRHFYCCGILDKVKPPKEGWLHWLALQYGTGSFRVHYRDEGDVLSRAIFDVRRDDVVEAVRRHPNFRATAPRGDEPPEAQANPVAVSPVDELLARKDEFERMAKVFAPAAVPDRPSALEAFIAQPAVGAALARVLQGLLATPPAAPQARPAAPVVAPAAPARSGDGMDEVVSLARKLNLTPQECVAAIAERAAASNAGAVDDDDEDDEDDEGEDDEAEDDEGEDDEAEDDDDGPPPEHGGGEGFGYGAE